MMDLEPVRTGLYRFKHDMIRPFLNSSREMEHNQTKFHSSKLHFNIYSITSTVSTSSYSVRVTIKYKLNWTLP